MRYEEALGVINGLLRFGSMPGLERISKLLCLLGNPQDSLDFIHIAGTNGKGSVSTLIASVLKEAGIKTGLYTSPYITNFRERISINGEMISEEDLAHSVERIKPYLDMMNAEGETITEFELITAIAFLYFKEQKCSLVVLETGLGGRLDATNVIKSPLVSIITSISYDHTAILGDTLKEIANEKCGIIKKGGTVVFLPQEQEVNDTVKNAATLMGCPVFSAESLELYPEEFKLSGTKLSYIHNGEKLKLLLPFIGKHQVKNAKTALAALAALKNASFGITGESIKLGFKNAFIPARLEVLSKSPAILLDGAHNPGGAAALKSSLNLYFGDTKAIFVIGMLKDKDVQESFKILKGAARTVITTPINNSRTMDAGEIYESAKFLFENVVKAENAKSAFDKAYDLQKQCGAPIVVCGSLYLASQLREYIIGFLR